MINEPLQLGNSFEPMRRIDIKPIPTIYNGIKFRSRLEAQWAVFFDSIGYKYQYQPEALKWNGLLYLVDFWLPIVKMFAEVKPTWITEEDDRKAQMIAMYSGKPCLILYGTPDFKRYAAVHKVDIDGEKDWYLCGYALDPWPYFLEQRFFSDPDPNIYTCSDDFSNDYVDAVLKSQKHQFGGANA